MTIFIRLHDVIPEVMARYARTRRSLDP